MSDERIKDSANTATTAVSAAPAETPASPAPAALASEKLDDVEGLDFLLEEIENKIAPLALA